MKKNLTLVFIFTLSVFLNLFLIKDPVQAAFNRNLLMDEVVFDNVGSMNAAQIDAWLNANFPSSCISTNKGFQTQDVTGYSPSTGFTYGANVSAGTAIFNAAKAYDINPQVLLVTLQKEQSLVTGTGSRCLSTDANQRAKAYAAAMGYNCPDTITPNDYSGINLYTINGVTVTSVTGTCVEKTSTVGFSRQLINAAWKLKFNEQRSVGNTSWNVQKPGWDNSDDPPMTYSGPMTQGYRARYQGGPAVYYDGYHTIDSTSIHIDTGPTASFYYYTPHFAGNENMVNIFTNWFGGTVSDAYFSCHNSVNVSGAPTGPRVIPNKLGNGADNLSLTIPNNTGSACIEVHTWLNKNYNQWVKQTATNSPAFNPTSVEIITADSNGDGKDELYKIDYCGGSGMLEVHGWTASNQGWASHIATNRPCISSANAEVAAADMNGDGRDEFYLIEYQNNGSGRVEVHGWTSNFQQWISHIATNYGAISPVNSQLVAADMNGDGRDEFYLVNYANTGSGMLEVHGWTPNFQQWISHIATNRPGIIHLDGSNNSVSDVISADTNGDLKDEFYLVEYRGTNSGRVEVHGWTPNFQQWISHIATNSGSF